MDNKVLDVEELLERVQDDKELLLELLEIFSEDYKEKRKLLDDIIQTNDFEQLKSIAHSLKGASGNISAKSLRENFLKLEEMGKNSDVSQAPDLLKNLDSDFSILEENINELKAQYSE